MRGRRIGVLALATVKEAVRARVFVSLLVVAAAIVLASIPAAELAIGDQLRLVQDFSMAGISVASTFLALFLGVSAVSGEVDRRTVYTIITKPASRADFVLGKFFGVYAVVALGAVICYAFAAAIVALLDSSAASRLIVPLYMLVLEMGLLVALATFFSCLTRPLLSSLFTFAIYVVGTSASSFAYWISRSKSEAFKGVMNFLHSALPDFELFDVRTEVVHQLAFPESFAWRALLYAVLYSAVLLLGGSAIFARRDLK